MVVVAVFVFSSPSAVVLRSGKVIVDIETSVGAAALFAIDGVVGIDQTRALLKDTVGERSFLVHGRGEPRP